MQGPLEFPGWISPLRPWFRPLESGLSLNETVRASELQIEPIEIMKIAKIVLLAAAAAGSFLAASCCESAPAPAAPKYVAPAK